MTDAERPPSAAAMRAIHKTMTDLGFSGPAISIYIRLLVQGSRTSRQLREAAGIGDAQLFDATQELKAAGLASGYRNGERTAWHCADPAVAWLSLAADVTWSAVASMSPIDQLPKTGIANVDQYSALYRAAARPAIRLWMGQGRPPKESRVAPNVSTLAQLAVETVLLARTRIRGISASPKITNAARFWPALMAQIKAGVAYVRLTDLTEVYEHGLDLVKRDISLGVDLRIGPLEDLTATRGYLADRRVLVRYDTAPVGEPPRSGYMTSDKHAIERFIRRFERLASSAVKAQVAVAHLESLVPTFDSAAASLSDDAQGWLKELVRVGRYANLPILRRWTSEHQALVERELRNAGLVVRTDAGFLLPRWPDPHAMTEDLQHST
ncbi:hypothetical protein AB0M79_09850 [Polymorphospora sp. NPDC051019]|uniref:hypothetical protein n=1 Tax=Polymorphospora sp. NPDC051019 TaxID=3155725 RepID=UPI003448FE36